MVYVPVPDDLNRTPFSTGSKSELMLDSNCLLSERILSSISFVIPTRTHTISATCERLVEQAAGIDVSLKISQPQVSMAIEEALANAIYHGNLEIDSELKEESSSAFWELAQERQNREPWKDRVVRIEKLVCLLGLWITITDEGAGFNTRRIMAQTQEPMELLCSGRGLVMMRAFSNDLSFNDRGNSVTLAFYTANEFLQENNSHRSGIPANFADHRL